MLIRRTKPIQRNLGIAHSFMEDRDAVQFVDFGKLFTPGTAMLYVHKLCDWIAQNAYDAETYFWDMTATQHRNGLGASTAIEQHCTGMLRSASVAIEEIIHTLSDLCARDYTYTFSFDEWRTQYAPEVEDRLSMVKEQVTLLNKLVENPRYDEIYRRYAGVAAPWHVTVDPAYADRQGTDPLFDTLDGIWETACALLELLGPHFPPVYTGQYPWYHGSPLPNGYCLVERGQQVGIIPTHNDDLLLSPNTDPGNAFRTISTNDRILLEHPHDLGTYTRSLSIATADGSLDTAFQDNLPYLGIVVSRINAVVVQPDGKILIGGRFDEKLLRLNPDGTVDEQFRDNLPEIVFNGVVRSIALQKDGRILFGGEDYGRIVRLHANGTEDLVYTQNTPHLGGQVRSLAIYPDCRVLVGGTFTGRGIHKPDYLCRLNTDGTEDMGFAGQLILGNYIDGPVNAVMVPFTVNAYVGGEFTGRLKRIRPSGAQETEFRDNLPDIPSAVRSLGYQPWNAYILYGVFASNTALRRVDNMGIEDETFTPSGGGTSGVHSIAVQSDHKILAGLRYQLYMGQTCLRRFEENGDTDTSFYGLGFSSGTTRAVAVQPSDGKILIGGDFPEQIMRILSVHTGPRYAATEFGEGFRLRKLEGTP